MNHTAGNNDYTDILSNNYPDNGLLFGICLNVNFCFGVLAHLVHSLYEHKRLHQYGKHTVGVVQSSKINIHRTKDGGNVTRYILDVVFPVQNCGEVLNTTLAYNAVHKNGFSTDSEKQSNTNDPESWTFIRKTVTVPRLETFNEAVETHRIQMIFDPKSPCSSASPTCVVMSQQSNTCSSICCRILTIAFAGFHLGVFLGFGCIFLFLAIIIFQNNVKNESGLQYFFTCMVAIMPSFMLGCCIYYYRSGQGNYQDELDGVDLEEVAAANSIPYMINHAQNQDHEYLSTGVENEELPCEIKIVDNDKLLL